MTTESVLNEALETASVDRMEKYGHPYDNYVVIQKLWAGILGMEPTFDQIAMCMMALKMGRQLTNSHRDNIVDIAGYCWVLDKVREKAGTPL